jgi:hypothetical protein
MAEKAMESNSAGGHVMGYLELGILIATALGVLGFAFVLAWVDASPRGRGETNFRETTD